MKYPNLRYGNPEELRYHAQGMPVKILAKRLRRTERTVRDWLEGKKKMPFWVPELVRLQNMEHTERLRQMRLPGVYASLGIVMKTGIVYSMPKREATEKSYLDVKAKVKTRATR